MALPSTTNTIRVPERTYRRLRGLAHASGKPMSVVLEEAVDRYEADRFFRELDASYRSLRSDENAWADEQIERTSLEGTLADGLGDN